MKIVSEIENLFFDLLFSEPRYLIYYTKFMHEILSSFSACQNLSPLVPAAVQTIYRLIPLVLMAAVAL